jgi:hypothetical protein
LYSTKFDEANSTKTVDFVSTSTSEVYHSSHNSNGSASDDTGAIAGDGASEQFRFETYESNSLPEVRSFLEPERHNELPSMIAPIGRRSNAETAKEVMGISNQAIGESRGSETMSAVATSKDIDIDSVVKADITSKNPGQALLSFLRTGSAKQHPSLEKKSGTLTYISISIFTCLSNYISNFVMIL